MTSKTLEKCDGSAEWLSGPVHVLCVVSGPIEPRTSAQELINEAAIEVFFRPLSNVTGPSDRWIEERVHSTLRPILLTHLHPRTLLQIVFQVTQIDKEAINTHMSMLTAALNAASLALIDSGFPMRSPIFASEFYALGDEVNTFPKDRAGLKYQSTMAVAIETATNNLAFFECSGRLKIEFVGKATQAALVMGREWAKDARKRFRLKSTFLLHE